MKWAQRTPEITYYNQVSGYLGNFAIVNILLVYVLYHTIYEGYIIL